MDDDRIGNSRLTLSFPRLHEGKSDGFEGCEARYVIASDAGDIREGEVNLSGEVVG